MDKSIILIEKVIPVFMKNGFNNLSMDALSGELQISKKTFYKYFPTKNDLIGCCADYIIKRNSARIDAIIAEHDNPIIALTKFLEFLGTSISRIGKIWIKDIQEFKPEIWRHIDKFRRNKLEMTITHIYRKGEKLGYFKPYPEPLIIQLFTQSILSVLSPEFLVKSDVSPEEILYDTIDVLLCGVLTPAGKNFYKRPNYRQKNEN